MINTVISIENLSKSYRLGSIGTGYPEPRPEPMVGKGARQAQPLPQDRAGGPVATSTARPSGRCAISTCRCSRARCWASSGATGPARAPCSRSSRASLPPPEGVVKVKGRIASLLEVGTGFHPELTGRENIYLNGAIFGMTREEVRRKFDEIVDFSGVEKFIDTPVKRYSSGMYVRLAFAVAAHLDPEILIVDEVLAVGDAEFQKKCLGKMGDVAGEGRTVLFVSHNMEAIQQLCKISVLLKSGEIADIGVSNEIIEAYLDEAARKYFLYKIVYKTG